MSLYTKNNASVNQANALSDLILFISVMLLTRQVYIEQIGFWGNTLFRSCATVGTATVLLYLRKQSWKSLGLIKPSNIRRMLGITVITFISTIVCILTYKSISCSPQETSDTAQGLEVVRKSLLYQIFIVICIWTESILEELQDRGFLLNRLESLFGNKHFSTILAVFIQAVIFGFRHSYDLSDRSITTGLIGLIFGIAYVFSGRNLWPLIIAHIVLNSTSMENHL